MAAAKRYDVAVVGAGPAGITAASTAADAGGQVLLIESGSRLGGSVSAAMHRSLCGLYSRDPQDPLNTLNAGGQRQVIANMVRRDPASVIPRRLGKTWVLEFPSAVWEASLLDLCSKSKIDRLMNCRVCEIRQHDGKIAAIRIDGEEPKWLEVCAVIDCTGGGAILELAGPDAMLAAGGEKSRMLGGFSIRLEGLAGNPDLLRLQIPYVLTRAVAEGTLPKEARFTLFHPGPGEGEGICKLAIHPAQFSSGEEIPLLAEKIVDHLRREIPGFAGARVLEMSPRPLARDGRRLYGNVIVSEQDVITARRHGDGAVHAWWPVEWWDPENGPSYAYPPESEHYDIPADALRSASVRNLFAGGMCISATAGAAASLRASGICLATGDAAGRLAAKAIR